MPRIKDLINHWSVTSKESSVADLRAIHLGKGWRDIGYHRVILHPESKEFVNFTPIKWYHLVKLGRTLDNDLYIEQEEVGAHTLYHNRDSVGICTIGHPNYELHSLQALAIVMTNLTLCNRFELDHSKAIKGHREFNPTQCPGDEIFELLEGLRNTGD